jgi:GMP synthase (glutamine-hydrolysing)
MVFSARTFVREKIEEIKDEVGSGKLVLALSGGVDSSVCAALAHKAVGRQLDCIFLDDGLMRQDEAESVRNMFESMGIIVRVRDVGGRFFSALRGLVDPEEKRLAFRETFYTVLGEAVRDSGAGVLIQGTIAADVEETKKGIKTQHNILEQIGVDPSAYGLKILEPLRELYKHEVRAVARVLDLPSEITERIPFPGPGLACRVVGEVTPERVEVVRKATVIVEGELSSLGGFQYFPVLFSDRATGVKDGRRVFGEIIAVRSVESRDALTASVSEVPWRKLKHIQQRITSEIPSVVKVVYDITPKPPSTIEYI